MVRAGRANRSEAAVLGAAATVLIGHNQYSSGSGFMLRLGLRVRFWQSYDSAVRLIVARLLFWYADP